MNFNKLLLKILIIALVGSAGIGIFLFLFGAIGKTGYQLLFSTLFIGGFCLTGLGCSVIYETKFRILSAAGMTISALALLLSILGIWALNRYESFWQLTIVFTILSFGMAHVCLFLKIDPKTSRVKNIMKLTVFVICLVALMLIKLTVSKFSEGDLYIRILGVFAILAVLGTIGTPLLNKISK